MDFIKRATSIEIGTPGLQRGIVAAERDWAEFLSTKKE